MIDGEQLQQIASLIHQAHNIVVIQGDNPDGDSLASSLALEELLGDQGKNVSLYCGIDIPEHLRFLNGWDRVSKELPAAVDLYIIVDCGFWKLLSLLEKNYGRSRLESKPTIVIDHHQDSIHDISSKVDLNQVEDVATGQVIYELAKLLDWSISAAGARFLAASILADSLGLTSEALRDNPRPFEVMAELVRLGVDVSELQEARLARLKISPDTLRFKGELLQRIEYFDDHRLATITIPYDEIKEHSQEFNPVVVLDELRNVEGVAVTIGFKQYVKAGKLVRVTGRIRCNRGYDIALKIAESFDDGGGHHYAAGFKVESPDINFQEVKNKAIARAIELLQQRQS